MWRLHPHCDLQLHQLLCNWLCALASFSGMGRNYDYGFDLSPPLGVGASDRYFVTETSIGMRVSATAAMRMLQVQHQRQRQHQHWSEDCMEEDDLDEGKGEGKDEGEGKGDDSAGSGPSVMLPAARGRCDLKSVHDAFR